MAAEAVTLPPVTTEAIRAIYNADEQRLFDSPDYVAIMLNGFREHIDRIHVVLSIVRHEIQPATVLDVGCGKGTFGCLMRWTHGARPLRIEGVDISDVVATHARAHGQYDVVHVLNACEPFDLDQRFDLVLCMELLEHVPDPAAVIANVRRHAHHWALFSCPVEHGPVDGTIHVRHVAPIDLERWVTEAGFTIRRSWFHRSEFCEQPHWQGWTFVLAEVA